MTREYVKKILEEKRGPTNNDGTRTGRNARKKTHGEDYPKMEKDPPIKLENCRILENLKKKLEHLPESGKQKLEMTIKEYRDIFADTPRQTRPGRQMRQCPMLC